MQMGEGAYMELIEVYRSALETAGEAFGENLTWLTDKLDQGVRQKDPETLQKLSQLNAAWVKVCKALNEGAGK